MFDVTLGRWAPLLVFVFSVGCSDDADKPNPQTQNPSAGTAAPAAAGSGGAGTAAASAAARALPAADQRGPYMVAKDENVGAGFENPPTNVNDQGDGTGCLSFISMFGGAADSNQRYAMIEPTYKIDLYTLYRPSDPRPGEKFPVLSWANGTCAKVIGYDGLLSHLASHGFIVIAANSRYTGSGQAQLKGVDWVLAQNDDANSPLYQHVATELIGLFGHSQGGASTWVASADPRVKTSIVLNAGASTPRSIPSFFLTGDMDVAFALNGSRSGAMMQEVSAFIQLHKGSNHITLMTEPARVYPAVTAWFRYHLLNDAEGRTWFAGDACKLCNQPDEWEYIAKGLP